MPTVGDVADFMRGLAPEEWAESWDRVGLQAGDPLAEVERVVVCLDVTPEVVARAEAEGAGMLVSHHPLIFRPPSSLREVDPEGRLLAAVVRARLAVYAAHTNLDAAPGGVNDCLAEALGLQDPRPLEPLPQPLLKLAVFVPPDHAEALLNAMAAAGAGRIGQYSHCSFQLRGTGTYLPLPGADPFQGEVGRLERAEEVRLEMVMPERHLEAVVAAMLAAHPYEEVAYDVYSLRRPAPSSVDGAPCGLGRVGRLEEALSLGDLAERVRAALGCPELGIVGDRGARVETVAVLGGSGGKYVGAASRAGAQVFVTGEVGHHDRLLARSLGLSVLDAGHEATERPVLKPLARRLGEAFPGLQVYEAPTPFLDPLRAAGG